MQTNEWSVVGEIFGLSGEVLPSVRVMDVVDDEFPKAFGISCVAEDGLKCLK